MRGTVAKKLKRQAREEYTVGMVPAVNLRYNELKKNFKIAKSKPSAQPKFKISKREKRISKPVG